MTQMNLFAATMKEGDHVRFTDHSGKVRESRIYGVGDPDVYGPGMLHVYSPWATILFVTVAEARLQRIDGSAA